MIRSYIASIRLALGLACVGTGILFICHWLGVIPDTRRTETANRVRQCEILAIASSVLVGSDQWSQLRTTLKSVVARNKDLLSVGVRSKDGQLRVDTGMHRHFWRLDHRNTKQQAVQVSIYSKDRPWGRVEFCFTAPASTGIEALVDHPTLRLASCFFAIGVFVYAFFMARVLRVFNSVQVVPDQVRQALDTLSEGLLLLDDRSEIILANRSFCQAIGLPAGSIDGKAASTLNWIADVENSDSKLPWISPEDELDIQNDQIVRYRLPNKQECVFSVNTAPIQAATGSRRGSLVTLRDVTHIEAHRRELEQMLEALRVSQEEITQKNRELEILATQDALTGCLNRRAFFERAATLFQMATRNGTPLSCIMVDNDHFKSINDTYGHHTGDEVLRAVGAMLNRLHQGSHLVCRYGGEEFCILTPGLTLSQAAESADLIRVEMTEIRLDSPSDLRLSASLGVSELRFGAKDTQGMINQADKCLYVAKRQGRNQVVEFNPSLDDAIEEPGPSLEDQVAREIDSLAVAIATPEGVRTQLSEGFVQSPAKKLSPDPTG